MPLLFQMSSITFSLVILLLWSSFQYACINARNLGVFHSESAYEDNQFSSDDDKKNDEIKLTNPARVSIEPARLRKLSTTNEAGSKEKSGKALENERVNSERNDPRKHVKVNGTGARKPESTVTWKVPHHKKKGDEQEVPGFNLDYLPPKTHPPVHN